MHKNLATKHSRFTGLFSYFLVTSDPFISNLVQKPLKPVGARLAPVMSHCPVTGIGEEYALFEEEDDSQEVQEGKLARVNRISHVPLLPTHELYRQTQTHPVACLVQTRAC